MTRRLLMPAGLALPLWACAPAAEAPPPQPETPAPRIGMANPASVHCVKRGGRVEIVTDKAGGQSGMCHLPDGTVIEEWALFRRDNP